MEDFKICADFLSNCRIYIAVQILLFLSVSGETTDSCPSVCNACAVGSLSCQNGGLISLPRLPKGIERITLVGHKFYDSTLRPTNLSHYQPPNFKITQITIQNCSVSEIEARTFNGLTSLNILDLSRNKLTSIEPDSFEGLSLGFLRLDENRGLRLKRNSFRGLIVRSLSLKACNIDHIEFETIEQIAGRLTNLLLSGNRLKVIDQRFEPIFRKLDKVDLSGNPIDCTCSVLWLARLFAWKSRQASSKNSFDSDNFYPVCKTPPSLEGRRMHEVPESAFHCAAPQLRALEVDLMSSSTGQLRCQATGSSTMQIAWRRSLSPLGGQGIVTSLEFGTKSAFLEIRRESPQEHYTCLVTDSYGNATADINIKWPPVKPPAVVSIDDGAGVDPSIRRFTDSPDGHYYSPDGQEKTIPLSSQFFRKQFTLLEMIGAVVGTFTATLALFLISYRLWLNARRKRQQKRPYATYAATNYSDSQIYDQPHHPMYPVPTAPSQFLDFKTQRQLFNNV